MPTVLDWLDLDIPRSCDGASLLPFLEGKTPPDWRNAVYFEHDFRDVRTQKPETALGISSDQCAYAAIRDNRFKYVHFAALPPLLPQTAGQSHGRSTPTPALRATSPPLDGGEEAQAARLGALPLPHEVGERWHAKHDGVGVFPPLP